MPEPNTVVDSEIRGDPWPEPKTEIALITVSTARSIPRWQTFLTMCQVILIGRAPRKSRLPISTPQWRRIL